MLLHFCCYRIGVNFDASVVYYVHLLAVCFEVQ